MTPENNKISNYSLTTFVFLKLLALIYFIAFISLHTQIDGLIGENGILPANDFLELVQERFGQKEILLFPTLCWISASNNFLHFLCISGIIFSIILFFNILPFISLFLLWVFYLSLVTVSQDFLSFQWDNLLLEVGFLSIFLVPISFYTKYYQPSVLVILLLKIVLFKLMLFSGIVKLLSGDKSWHDLTALTFHYFTQPIPNPVSYYFHQLPIWFHRISCFVMFVIELLVPFLIFAFGKMRYFSALILILFQVLIIITGNYCFFNLLTICLCILLFDDYAIKKVFPIQNHLHLSKWIVIPLFIFISLVNLMLFTYVLRLPVSWPKAVNKTYSFIYPFRSVNSYGLFSIMTTKRPEIIIEGSDDGRNWFQYEFKYKPGALDRCPPQVAPHQPRLDWQMWFAAFGSYRNNPWFVGLVIKLLESSSDVLKLLKENPFPTSPPKYIRALVYNYNFTDFETKKRTGNFWYRELKGLYFPVVTLENNKLMLVQ